MNDSSANPSRMRRILFFEDEPPSLLGRDGRKKQKPRSGFAEESFIFFEATPHETWIAEPRSGEGNPVVPTKRLTKQIKA